MLLAITLTRDQLKSLFVEGNDWGRCLVGAPGHAKLTGIVVNDHVTFYFHVRGPKRVNTGKAVWERQRSLSMETKELGK